MSNPKDFIYLDILPAMQQFTQTVYPPPPKSPVERLEELVRERDEMAKFIEDIRSEASVQGIVIDVGRKLLVKVGNSTVEAKPHSLFLEVGDVVSLHQKTYQILGKSDLTPPYGSTVTVKRVEGVNAEVDIRSTTKFIKLGKFIDAKPGDRLALDTSDTIALANFGQDTTTMAFAAETGVSWDDIGGQEDAKAAMIEAIEGPVKHRTTYLRYNKKPTKGVLLYGPPGNGKTMLGKAAATAIAALHGKEAAKTGFIYVKGPELLSKWVGSSEENVRTIFSSARLHHERHGYPAIVFIDEAESLLTTRGTRFTGMEATIVPSFLAEMDGLTESGAIVLLATNRPDELDPAIVRDGRIDRKVFVARPDRNGAREILKRHLRGRPTADVDGLLRGTLDFLFGNKASLYKITFSTSPDRYFGLKDMLSGAMLAAIVDRAALIAMDREIETGDDSGICVDDTKCAIEDLMYEQRNVDVDTAWREYCASLPADTVIETVEELATGKKVIVHEPQKAGRGTDQSGAGAN